MPRSTGARAAACIALATALYACSPSLNWRTLTLGSLRFTLPCKPDQAARDVVLGEASRALEMRGCEADGALFAISRIALEPADDASAIVQAWKVAALTAMQAKPSTVLDVAPPSYRRLPEAKTPVWLSAKGRQSQGAEIQAQLGWMVVGREVFHLAVYSPNLVSAAVAPMMTDIDRPQ
jgi:hypothetical protein